MNQLDTHKVTIRIQGAIEQNRRKQEIASILRLLAFAHEELSAFGLDKSAQKIRDSIDSLERQCKIN